MTQTRDLIKKMADFFTGEEFYEKEEDAILELSPDDVRCMNEVIKACGNAVSRQAVKEQMIKYGFHAPDMTVTEFVEDLPSVRPQDPKWIPVSEKLPKKNNWYSCTVELSDSHYVTMDLYFKNGKWLDNRRIDMFRCYELYGFGKSTEKHRLDYSELLEDFDWTKRVIAWMPLPKPFDPQEDKEKE